MLKPAKPEACTIAPPDAKYIRAWSRHQLAELEKPRRHLNWLTLRDIESLVRQVYVGQGRAQDPSGAILPLVCFGIERLDSAQGYEPGNVRVLENGQNRLKNSDPSHRRLIAWLSGARGLVGPAAPEDLPGSSHCETFFKSQDGPDDGRDTWAVLEEIDGVEDTRSETDSATEEEGDWSETEEDGEWSQTEDEE